MEGNEKGNFQKTEGFVVGFVGSEKYDIILYLSRILYHLGSRVLVIDLNENKAVSSCIPYGGKNRLGERDGKEEILEDYIDYRGVHYFQEKVTESDDRVEMERYLTFARRYYDVILMDMGFGYATGMERTCDKLFFTTDQQKHNLERIAKIDKVPQAESYMILKDICSTKITSKVIRQEFHLDIEEGRIFRIYQDEEDMRNKIHCQYNAAISFSKISGAFMETLLEITAILYPESSRKEISLAYAKAKKGA
ncbi:MAG: hypothetical protein E7256_13145 [Lachnospiraceae bacterium]|nr:hypothetical protein [Lachnospiraceae bacterium]